MRRRFGQSARSSVSPRSGPPIPSRERGHGPAPGRPGCRLERARGDRKPHTLPVEINDGNTKFLTRVHFRKQAGGSSKRSTRSSRSRFWPPHVPRVQHRNLRAGHPNRRCRPGPSRPLRPQDPRGTIRPESVNPSGRSRWTVAAARAGRGWAVAPRETLQRMSMSVGAQRPPPPRPQAPASPGLTAPRLPVALPVALAGISPGDTRRVSAFAAVCAVFQRQILTCK